MPLRSDAVQTGWKKGGADEASAWRMSWDGGGNSIVAKLW